MLQHVYVQSSRRRFLCFFFFFTYSLCFCRAFRLHFIRSEIESHLNPCNINHDLWIWMRNIAAENFISFDFCRFSVCHLHTGSDLLFRFLYTHIFTSFSMINLTFLSIVGKELFLFGKFRKNKIKSKSKTHLMRYGSHFVRENPFRTEEKCRNKINMKECVNSASEMVVLLCDDSRYL